MNWKKLCSHTFKAFSEEVIVMHSEKRKEKYMQEDVWKFFFEGWNLDTLLEVNFFTDSFQGI